jgi:hypothetical protein
MFCRTCTFSWYSMTYRGIATSVVAPLLSKPVGVEEIGIYSTEFMISGYLINKFLQAPWDFFPYVCTCCSKLWLPRRRHSRALPCFGHLPILRSCRLPPCNQLMALKGLVARSVARRCRWIRLWRRATVYQKQRMRRPWIISDTAC